MNNQPVNTCICCGAAAPRTWFCPTCTIVKEKAYTEARILGLMTHAEVIALRDKRLSEHREKHMQGCLGP